MMAKNSAKVAAGRLGGKKGGPARAKALSKKVRKKIAVHAANVRWHGDVVGGKVRHRGNVKGRK